MDVSVDLDVVRGLAALVDPAEAFLVGPRRVALPERVRHRVRPSNTSHDPTRLNSRDPIRASKSLARTMKRDAD